MTVQSTESFVNFSGDGTTNVFPFDFPSLRPEWVFGAVDGVIDENVQVTLNANQDEDPGGTLAFLGGSPPNNSLVSAIRFAEATQLLNYPRNGRFPSEATEQALDKLTMIAQDILNLSNFQTLRVPENFVRELPEASERAGNFLGFDANGQPETVQPVIGNTGPQGPQGEQGPAGPQGIEGPQGVQGEQGPQGVEGPQGVVGPQGNQGEQGPTGPQGGLGPEGPTGPVGPQGPQGASLDIQGDATVAEINALSPSSINTNDAWVMLDSGLVELGPNSGGPAWGHPYGMDYDETSDRIFVTDYSTGQSISEILRIRRVHRISISRNQTRRRGL